MLSLAKRVREAVTPARRTSAFLTRGVLTPEEYIAAGDQLVFKCPTWSWEGGDPSRNKDCLPDKEKQFLVTRNVPCRRRARALEGEYVGDKEVRIGDGTFDGDGDEQEDAEESWLEPNVVAECPHGEIEGAPRGVAEGGDDDAEELELDGRGVATEDGEDVETVGPGLGAIQLVESHFGAPSEVPGSGHEGPRTVYSEGGVDAPAASGGAGSGVGMPVEAGGDDEDCPDLDSYVEDNLMQGDEATMQAGAAYMRAQEPEDYILPTRTYDLSITYDKHHQTPRMWLFGYDESGQPLSAEQVFEDVMQDYAKQTVTMELHPHLPSHHASVHPCKHADTMKVMLSNLTKGGKEARVDQYLFIFLKFIQSVVPTIDYDYTMTVDAGGGDANTADAFVEVEGA